GSDAEVLDDLSAGHVPNTWAPLETSTTEEAVFLAPLDHVCARGRAKDLFGFDYVWEVYKPEHQRKFGYYTLPILWGERLIARFDSKLDRTTNTFVILGLWLEDEALGNDEGFAEALACAFARFSAFLGASELDATAIGEPLLRQRANTSKEANVSRFDSNVSLNSCGSEHRGQICTILGALGHEPPDLTPWAYAFASGRMRE